AGVPLAEAGTTNLMKIHVVGEQITKGQGIGRKAAKGKVVVAKTAEEALENVTEGSIFVTTSTDKDMVPAIEKAAALVVEEGGLTSHAAVVGVS
ncbi:PEP-utilizing enzyme, partial [Streptococcus sobrinus]